MEKLSLESLAQQINICKLCEGKGLLAEAGPCFQANPKAKILIAAQAPGKKAHETRIVFNDPSGDRLREWMNIEKSIFYDEKLVSILPMGFCYPGKAKSGDHPPVPLCSQTWHHQLLPLLTNIELILTIGQYSHKYYLGKQRKKNLTETVRSWREYPNNILPLPHPSPLNNIWLKKNPWFEFEVLPELKKRVHFFLSQQ